jgi:hypothetical protein
MEKTSRISKPAVSARDIEAMRQSADTIDGILSGVYSALAGRTDIAREILLLLEIGAAKSQVLTEDLAAMTRPSLVRN